MNLHIRRKNDEKRTNLVIRDNLMRLQIGPFHLQPVIEHQKISNSYNLGDPQISLLSVETEICTHRGHTQPPSH